ncbi:MAG TPA: hypothetical protein VIP46_22675, partial [Pyrinomonadaceae bacterium]
PGDVTGRGPAAPGDATAASLAPLAQAAPAFETFEDVMPKEGDYIYPLFRALSQTIIEGHWLDFTTPGVLEASVPLLERQTVYKNHNFYDVEKWLGVVNQAAWDATGEQTGGVPGINVELKIDWKVNPLIARGLLMEPPAIHSVSVTVIADYDYSHPELIEKGFWAFYDMLGEEVNGEIVRFIVTKITAYWEISLVFQGADTNAKFGDMAETARESFTPREQARPAHHATARPSTESLTAPAAAGPGRNGGNTVKLPANLRATLGITGEHADDEVPDELVSAALTTLNTQAEAGRTLLDSARAECLRVATLAEAGAEGTLPSAIADIIAGADAPRLANLTQLYQQKVAGKFPASCQDCGSTNVVGRSSVEARPEGTGDEPPASRQPYVHPADSLHA